MQLGKLHQQLGNAEKAIDYQQQALGFVSDPLQVAALLLNLGSSCRAVSRLAKAISFYQELLTTVALLDEDTSEQRLMHMMGLYCLGQVYQTLGEIMTAWRYCREALALADQATVPLVVKCLDLQQELAEEIGNASS